MFSFLCLLALSCSGLAHAEVNPVLVSRWPGYARLNSDGTADTTFQPRAGFDRVLGPLAGGGWLVTRAESDENGTSFEEIMRLDSSGAIDPSLDTAAASAEFASLLSAATDSSGRVLLLGWKRTAILKPHLKNWRVLIPVRH